MIGDPPEPYTYKPPASYYALPSAPTPASPANTWSQRDQNSALMLMLGAQQMNNAMRPRQAPAYQAPIQCNHYQYRTVCW